MKYKVGTYIISCFSDSHTLTKDKMYQLVESDDLHHPYLILDDRGVNHYFSEEFLNENFKIYKNRKEKLERILK
jgi:hypothetical protein